MFSILVKASETTCDSAKLPIALAMASALVLKIITNAPLSGVGDNASNLVPSGAPGSLTASSKSLSTNADAIANAIGSFAESQVVSDAFTRILNKDRFLAKAQSDASLSVQKVEAVALIARLDAETTAAATARTGVDATVSYVRALSALAQSLGYTGPEFGGIPAAQEWFALENAQSRGTR